MTPPHGEPRVPDRASARFAGAPASVHAARQFTARKLAEWGSTVDSTLASLIVSELASNAVQHGHSDFELELRHLGDSVQISVSDASGAGPVLGDPAPESDHGFGMKIVTKLASEWGVDIEEGGKQVWVRLAGVRRVPTPRSAIEHACGPAAEDTS